MNDRSSILGDEESSLSSIYPSQRPQTSNPVTHRISKGPMENLLTNPASPTTDYSMYNKFVGNHGRSKNPLS